jgi:hypothetical protein
VLALIVVVSQPVASLAWLGGMHATLEQAALHQAAVEDGHNHHHGALEHHKHQHDEHRADNTDVHFSRSILGPEFVSAAPYAGPFQDLLQTLFQAMLVVLAETPSPGAQLHHTSTAKELPSQHSPSVPHRPPILLPLILTIA